MNALTTTQPQALEIQQETFELDVQRVLQQTIAIQKLMEGVLHKGEHFGEIPGVKPKPGEKPKMVLFKSGAEKLCLMFRLRPEYEIVSRREDPTFISFEIRCRLYHIPTSNLIGEGIGSINSRESKYLNQTSAKLCPECGQAAIIKGKEEYGGGWICFAKKGGCGAKFADDDKSIVEQPGKPTEAKVWDLHNTLIKMGQKRALVAATLIATAASDVFTQDLEELEDASPKPAHQPAEAEQQHDATKPAEKKNEKRPGPLTMLVDTLKMKGEDTPARALGWMSRQLKRDVKATKELKPDEIAQLTTLANEIPDPGTGPQE